MKPTASPPPLRAVAFKRLPAQPKMPFHLADAVFWAAVACCSIAQLAILRSAIVSPARARDSQTPSSGGRRATEIAWAVLPGVALAVLFVYTWSAMHQYSAIVAASVTP